MSSSGVFEDRDSVLTYIKKKQIFKKKKKERKNITESNKHSIHHPKPITTKTEGICHPSILLSRERQGCAKPPH